MASRNRILVIDPDPVAREIACLTLNEAGYRCLAVRSGTDGLTMARSGHPDLIVLDISIPDLSGVEILKYLKSDLEITKIPIIAVTARGEEKDRITALEVGADDCLTKPFNPRELILRLAKILRRSEGKPSVLQCRNITLNEESYEVRVGGHLVYLTATEFSLLSLLLKNQGRLLSRDHLLKTVWGYREGHKTRTVDTHVQRLRRKLSSEKDCLQTIRGQGYKISEIEGNRGK
ncbi:MAG: response regulator transcription factor [Acidobacteriota bacterium]